MRKVIANRDRIEEYFADREHYDTLHSMCVMIYRNRHAAENALQDICEKFLTKADTIEFPENPDEVLPFMYTVIRNHRLDEIKHRKKAPQRVELAEEWLVKEEETTGDVMKLEDVNLYIQDHRNLFTEDENILWDCIYDARSTHDKMQALGKTSNNLYVMHHRLLAKIHRLMEQGGLI